MHMAGPAPTLSRIDALCQSLQTRSFISSPLFAHPTITGSRALSGRDAKVVSPTLRSHRHISLAADRDVRARFEADSHERENIVDDEWLHHPFNLDLAVILAGFAFEAYNTPPEKAGIRELDAGECETTYTCNRFLREVYKGQLRIKLKGGSGFPALDLWGTSDPYVVLNIGGSIVRSRTCWATLEPVWNEDLSLNVKDPTSQSLNVAAWDANVITAHKRMGNTSVSLETLATGDKQELELQLEGLGGGGRITLELEFKTFEEIDEENRGWGIKLLSEFFKSELLDTAIRSIFGNQGIKARDFVSSSLGLKYSQQQNRPVSSATTLVSTDANTKFTTGLQEDGRSSSDIATSSYFEPVSKAAYKALEVFRLTTTKLPSLDLSNWELDEKVAAFGLNSQARAEAHYVERGLALPSENETDNQNGRSDETRSNTNQQNQVSREVLRQTEEILGSWVMQSLAGGRGPTETASSAEEPAVDEQREKEDLVAMENGKAIFKTAESAMEAWAMLATSCGGQSFVKSEFDKICFLENRRTDTQVAIWRDVRRHRLVVAFRGTEQTRWRDVQTDLMLVPTGLNPERVGGGISKDELTVHSGFLTAYDSVRPRLLSILQDVVNLGMEFPEGESDRMWHVYVTGHSLGGALATLFALELSTSRLAKSAMIKVTMYNYGSPRVGNKMFAQKYNTLVKDSWRIVNHRDIIPTVPRLMGYCHVAEPIYLAKSANLLGPAGTRELLEDGYRGDVIGETTPDYIIEEFLKGEMQLLEKLVHTEIAMFRSIRDGSAIMQHMEDFYYIALLELVEKKMSSSTTM